jgi:hypothetical protein
MNRSVKCRRATGASVGAVLGLALALAAPAVSAARPKTHKLNVTAVFDRRPGVAPSASFTATGTIAGSPFGHGAIVRQVTVAGNVLSVRLTLFGESGSVSGTATDRRTFNPNGSVSFTVTSGRILRGAGAYRGATGKFTGSGSEPNLTASVTERLHGTVRY